METWNAVFATLLEELKAESHDTLRMNRKKKVRLLRSCAEGKIIHTSPCTPAQQAYPAKHRLSCVTQATAGNSARSRCLYSTAVDVPFVPMQEMDAKEVRPKRKRRPEAVP